MDTSHIIHFLMYAPDQKNKHFWSSFLGMEVNIHTNTRNINYIIYSFNV